MSLLFLDFSVQRSWTSLRKQKDRPLTWRNYLKHVNYSKVLCTAYAKSSYNSIKEKKGPKLRISKIFSQTLHNKKIKMTKKHMKRCCISGVNKIWPMSQIQPSTYFHKALFKHSDAWVFFFFNVLPVLLMASFMLRWQNWVVAIETEPPARFKIFSNQPFIEKVYWLLCH